MSEHNDWLAGHYRSIIAQHLQGIKWHQSEIEKIEKKISELEG